MLFVWRLAKKVSALLPRLFWKVFFCFDRVGSELFRVRVGETPNASELWQPTPKEIEIICNTWTKKSLGSQVDLSFLIKKAIKNQSSESCCLQNQFGLLKKIQGNLLVSNLGSRVTTLVLRHDACANEWIDGMLLGSNGRTFLGRNHLGKSPPIHVGFSRGFCPPKKPGFGITAILPRMTPKKGGGKGNSSKLEGCYPLNWGVICMDAKFKPQFFGDRCWKHGPESFGMFCGVKCLKLSCLDLLGEHVI